MWSLEFSTSVFQRSDGTQTWESSGERTPNSSKQNVKYNPPRDGRQKALLVNISEASGSGRTWQSSAEATYSNAALILKHITKDACSSHNLKRCHKQRGAERYVGAAECEGSLTDLVCCWRVMLQQRQSCWRGSERGKVSPGSQQKEPESVVTHH